MYVCSHNVLDNSFGVRQLIANIPQYIKNCLDIFRPIGSQHVVHTVLLLWCQVLLGRAGFYKFTTAQVNVVNAAPKHKHDLLQPS